MWKLFKSTIFTNKLKRSNSITKIYILCLSKLIQSRELASVRIIKKILKATAEAIAAPAAPYIGIKNQLQIAFTTSATTVASKAKISFFLSLCPPQLILLMNIVKDTPLLKEEYVEHFHNLQEEYRLLSMRKFQQLTI